MSRWIRIQSDLLNDPTAQRMDPAAFRDAFMAAVRGGESPLGDFVKPCGRPTIPGWAIIRPRIFARDDFTCRYCGERGRHLECDHVIPLSRGGTTDDDNLVTACLKCNRRKGARTPEEWRA